jgi:hypothetical protein
MTSETDIRERETANPGRGANGRFQPGNPGGPGNPLGGRIAAARGALRDRVTDEDLNAIWDRVIAMAKDGHWQAIKLVLSYVASKPGKMPDLQDFERPSPNGVFAAPPSPNGVFCEVPVAAPSPNGVIGEVPVAAPSPNGVLAAPPSPNGVFSAAPSPNGVFSAPPSPNGVFGEVRAAVNGSRGAEDSGRGAVTQRCFFRAAKPQGTSRPAQGPAHRRTSGPSSAARCLGVTFFAPLRLGVSLI